MSDWTARDLDLDFSFLPDGNFSMDAYQDGVNADRPSQRLQTSQAPGQ